MTSSDCPRILIVEDEIKWRKNLLRCEYLAELSAKCERAVVVAEGYQSAKSSIDDNEEFALAITDVFLEDLESQYEWNSLARLLQRKNIPIIVVSGLINDADHIARMVNDFQVVGFFHKSRLDPHEFSNHIRGILSKDVDMENYRSPDSVITWLHLSDLHFRDSDQYDRSIVISALWKDLEHWKDLDIFPDFIVVTGDIAYSGKTYEYEFALDFLDKLLIKTGLGKDRLFLVPGNHDVDRSRITPFARSTWALNDRDSVRGILENSGSRDLFMGRLSGYAGFVNSYFADAPEQIEFDSREYFYVKKLNLGNYTFAILGLNSAWSSGNAVLANGGEIHDKGNLVLGEKQVRDAIEQSRGVDFRIALMHHPLSYLNDFDYQAAIRLMGRDCDFLLRGHLHESDFERKTSLQGELIVIPSGAVYQDRKLVNSYNLVVLDPERRKARAHFRRYSDMQEKWLKDLDVTGEDNDGELLFDLSN